jgi:5'-3' exonuclease
MKQEPLVLIDLSNLAFRSHYRHNLSYEGKPTGVLYGVLQTILMLKRQFGDNLVFCWDTEKQHNWRLKYFPTYKELRGADPKVQAEKSLVYEQLTLVREVLTVLGYPNVKIVGLEADDVIGLVASNTQTPVAIYATDHDFYQLLDEHVRIVAPKFGGGFRIVTQQDAEREAGIPIDLWAMYLALGADKSDDIHVMKGTGPKTAVKMLNAGMHLGKQWKDQPAEARKQYARCEPYWKKFQAAFMVAQIPRSWNDNRLPRIPASERYTHSARTYAECALEEFTTICADYGMAEHLAKREQFFNQPVKESKRDVIPSYRRHQGNRQASVALLEDVADPR